MHKDWKAEFERRGGRGVCVWTPEERAILFGDCNPNRQIDAKQSYEDELVRRYLNGEPLSKADKKEARRIIAAR